MDMEDDDPYMQAGPRVGFDGSEGEARVCRDLSGSCGWALQGFGPWLEQASPGGNGCENQVCCSLAS